MDKILKNIINNTIEREYQNVMGEYAAHLRHEPKLKDDDEKYSKRFDTALKELYKILPKEKHNIVDELEEAAGILMGIESRVAFKQGLILGLTELSYLGEVGQEIAYI